MKGATRSLGRPMMAVSPRTITGRCISLGCSTNRVGHGVGGRVVVGVEAEVAEERVLAHQVGRGILELPHQPDQLVAGEGRLEVLDHLDIRTDAARPRRARCWTSSISCCGRSSRRPSTRERRTDGSGMLTGHAHRVDRAGGHGSIDGRAPARRRPRPPRPHPHAAPRPRRWRTGARCGATRPRTWPPARTSSPPWSGSRPTSVTSCSVRPERSARWPAARCSSTSRPPSRPSRSRSRRPRRRPASTPSTRPSRAATSALATPSLSIMVGGTVEAFERGRPVLDAPRHDRRAPGRGRRGPTHEDGQPDPHRRHDDGALRGAAVRPRPPASTPAPCSNPSAAAPRPAGRSPTSRPASSGTTSTRASTSSTSSRTSASRSTRRRDVASISPRSSWPAASTRPSPITAADDAGPRR